MSDELYLDKVGAEVLGTSKSLTAASEKVKNKIRPVDQRWHKKVVREYIHHYKPDVLFVRENSPFEASFWGEFGKECLLVDRIAMNIPWGWSPTHFDLIFTSLEHYKEFFESNEIPTEIFFDGFDERILREIDSSLPKKYEVSHAGGMGRKRFAQKTALFEKLARKSDLAWWGWTLNDLDEDSPLRQVYKGFISGLEMYQAYQQSMIVVNDYGTVAKGVAVNQRLFEVMGVGSLLLTREADNLKDMFPKDLLVTYSDENDCLDKIDYYLKNEAEREEIASRAQEFVLRNFNYKNLMVKLATIIEFHWKQKFRG